MNNIKNIIFDLGGVILNLDYSNTIKEFNKLGVFNFEKLYSQKKQAKILFLGITFKEDVPDLRNSKAIELLNYFKKNKFNILINDPFINDNSHIKYNDLIENSFDAVIITVPHTFYKTKFLHIKQLLKKDGILFDIKGIFRNKISKNYWSL